MMTQINTQQQSQQNVQTQDELILVVPRAQIFADTDAWHGLKEVDFEQYLQIITDKKEFLPRSAMEIDFNYKQIIPYLIFTHDNNYFVMQRKSDASEVRLRNKITLGIGGHIREEDMNPSFGEATKNMKVMEANDVPLFSWAVREFHEEVNYAGDLKVKPLGILNDDSNDVGKVHIGFVLLLQGNNADISVKSELKSGKLMRLDDCYAQRELMESWSQFVVDFLRSMNAF
jgi:predicted NUDIX family phosphoesterase